MLRRLIRLSFLSFTTLLISLSILCQELYFPPLSGSEWETTTIEELGWCSDAADTLVAYLDEIDTKAFIVLKDGGTGQRLSGQVKEYIPH